MKVKCARVGNPWAGRYQSLVWRSLVSLVVAGKGGTGCDLFGNIPKPPFPLFYWPCKSIAEFQSPEVSPPEDVQSAHATGRRDKRWWLESRNHRGLSGKSLEA